MTTATPDVLVIDLNPIVENCRICGNPSHNTGIPMYEDMVLPNDWPGEWGGQPACRECFEIQGLITKPMDEATFKRLRGVI